MKKSLINKLYKYSTFTLLASVFALALSSCNIGLGEAIDLTAPTVNITSHQDNDSVGTTFKLFGTANDNEKLARLTIDFDDADIHYQITAGGTWQKKTSRSNGWQTILSDANNYCTQTDGSWSWSIEVDTSQASADKTGNTYNLLAVVEDERGNSGRSSKAERSLIVDEHSPTVSIYKPELFDNYSTLNTKVNNNEYRTEDGNVISQLLNGTLQLYGRQEDALTFKALRIEFDNGTLPGRRTTANTDTAVSSIDEVLALGDTVLDNTKPASRTYFTKTLTGSELREWSVTVRPEEWATNTTGIAYGLNDGIHVTVNGKDITKPHIIRIVTTSLSTSNMWERSVLGYFLWNPAADRPWITLAIGDDPNANGTEPSTITTECYPKSNISGQVQDDDGIQSFESILYKKNVTSDEYEEFARKTHALPQTNAGESPKYAAWTIEAPSSNGVYKLVLKVKDIYGSENTLTKYFKTSDVSAPKIEDISPASGDSIFSDSTGDITFTGTVTDDGAIESVEMVWLNPALRNNTANKIKYLNASNTSWITEWNETTGVGFKTNQVTQDSDGNKLFRFNVQNNPDRYSIDKTFNLFTDFGIDGNTKQLVAQEFIFRAYDGHTASVKAVTLTGDTTAPSLGFNTITIGSTTESIANAPTYPASANGVQATITGYWSDTFKTGISNTTKVKPINITWGSGDSAQTATAMPVYNGTTGTWTASIIVPSGGGTITATITDFGGNIKTVQGAVRVETNELGLARIGCLNDDGAYTTNKDIYLTLEFTKNTNVVTTNGSPTLTLSNGGIAYFVPGDFTINGRDYSGYGSGTPIHVFKYTVGATSGETDVDKLFVTAINANGAKWIDTATAASEHPDDITSKIKIATSSTDTGLQASSNLAATRSIKIDTTAPRVKEVKVLSSADYYSANKDILIWLEFNEDVDISGEGGLKVNFSAPSGRYAGGATISGSRYVLLTYTVNPATNTEGTNGDNANPLTFGSITGTGVTVTDKAGNSLSNWAPENTTNFAGRIIDTKKPNPPEFRIEHGSSTTWNPQSIIFDLNGTRFGLSGESGATIEYTTDGQNWVPYNNETIELINDQTYHVMARQTDAAGNLSSNTSEKTFTIDKGELFTRITANTVSGVYSVNTANEIAGKIEFRKDVKIEQGAKVRLNVKRGANNYLEVPLTECASAAAERKIFNFVYTIQEGDSIYTPNLSQTDTKYGLLDVIDWSFNTIQFADTNGDYKTYTITKPSASTFATAKRFNSNREIKVLTGLPTVVSNGIALTEQENSTTNETQVKISVTFDREITKVNGNITITQDLTGYHVPTVLTVDEYNEYCGKIQSVMEANYFKGSNGASSSLVNDTSTKYILNFDKDDTDATLVKAFTADSDNPTAVTAKSHIVTIPIVADDVYTVNSSGEKSDKGYTLVIDLNDTYKLPVKGAKYSLSIPANAVTDEVQNKNLAITKTDLQSSGVEPPVIRMLKPSYSIDGLTGSTTTPQYIESNTKNASANMTAAKSAQIRIDCRTPGAVIKYNTNTRESNAVTINSKTATSSESAKPSVPTASLTYNSTSATEKIIKLADKNENGQEAYRVNTYNNAKGVKVAIIASATANGKTKTSYEYATRTVLKFHIDDYDDHDYAKGSNTAPGNNLKFKDLKVWITGGDATYGGNSLDPFPLSWAIPGNFKLMNGAFTADGDDNMTGDFYWVTWDITTKTYHGFVIGTVPSDAVLNGPSVWFSSECSWVTLKNNYPLYPGETLIMDTKGVTPAFAFRDKNRGSR